MTNPSRKTARTFRFLGQGLFGLLAIGCLTSPACPQAPGPRSEGQAGAPSDSRPRYDVTPRRMDLIMPGTVIDKGPPRDWTHLIIKSNPRVGAGDMKAVPKSAITLSSLLYTAIVARVEEKAGRHRLAAVAVGLGTRVDGKDMIVSPEKQKELGANLGLLERLVLSKAQEKLAEVQVVVRSDTLALIDAPGLLQRDGKHQPVVLRYAVLVDPATGKLETLLWAIDRDERGGYAGVAGPVEWLPPNKMEDCVLHVAAHEFSLLGPSENAFAMNRVPQGQKQLTLTAELKPLAGRMRLTEEMAQELETKLRAALKQ
jgi:hypothetical protein